MQLYASGVLIMEKCADLLPDYFSFVKGVVDSQDLSLNISREMLQQDGQLKLIRGSLEKKIKNELNAMKNNEREKYDEFFKNFGRQLKFGCYADYGMNAELLKDLLLFYSAKEKKLITLAAQKSGLSDEFIANNEQRVRNGFMQNLAASAAYSSGFFSSQYLPLSESIFISEAQVIRDIAAKESAVIVGRCADYILAGRDNTINVFVYAPRETRVNRIMARRNLSEAEALKAITTSDKERGNHYFRYTDQKWGKAQNYDICINSALMGIEKTAEMLTAMAKIEVRA